MTADSRQQPEADGYELISRAREAVPGLPTAQLYRIHALLERLLNGDRLDPHALSELARELDGSALD